MKSPRESAEEMESAIRELLFYDPDTGLLHWKIRKSGVRRNRVAGHIRKSGYIVLEINGKTLRSHRVAWFLYYGKWPENEIDHIDRNPSNNKIDDLRDVSHRVNMGNGKGHKAGRLVGARLATRNKTNPWEAQIHVDGKKVHLGYFPTEQAAHEKYKQFVEVG